MTINPMTRLVTRRASATLATAGVLLAVVIAGCGGSGKGSQPASGASPAAHGYGTPAKASVNGSENKHSAPSTEGRPPAAGAAAASRPRQKPATSSTESQAPAAGAEGGGIPQNNGGDQDADNNGGPSDGDGNV
jgi:hypothetical protein